MHTQQIHTPATQQISKHLDHQKIKNLLSRKLQKKISNPQQIIQSMNDQLQYHIQKTSEEISKQLQRQSKLKKVEQYELKSRSLLNQKINDKMQKSIQKKTKQQKQKLQKKLKARKIKQEYIENKKRQIRQTEFKPRLEKFKSFMSVGKNLNKSLVDQEDQNYVSNGMQTSKSLLKFSIRSNIQEAQLRNKELDEINYFKKMEKISKKKIYDKLQPKVKGLPAVDKLETAEKIAENVRNKFIQKLGSDLAKIQAVRIKMQKSTKEKLQKIKKQNQLLAEQRFYKLETLKQTNMQLLKTRRENLSRKAQKYLLVRNRSTPLLMRNFSNLSQMADVVPTNNQQLSPQKRTNSEWKTSKLSRTVQNFKISLDEGKAQKYLQKEKEKRIKKQIRQVFQQVLKDQKSVILVK